MNKKNSVVMLLIVVCVLIFTVQGFSIYLVNKTEKSFTDPGEQVTTTISSENISSLIIKGAVSFYKGKANIDVLVSKLEAAELEGSSFSQLQALVADALANMTVARNYYQTLNTMAANLQYNPTVIEQLKVFDYLSLSREYGMNMDMFNQAKGYLLVGDIRGAYARVYAYADTIIKMLETVQNEMITNGIPETSTIFRLNQECVHMLLFGQYMAQVFKNIR